MISCELSQRIRDPAAFIDRCKRKSFLILFAKYTSGSAVSSEAIAFILRDEEKNRNAEDLQENNVSTFDHSVTEISELSDIWKTKRTKKLAELIRRSVIAKRPQRTIWKDKLSKAYIPEVDHFKQFVAAHNEHASKIQKLIGGEGTLCRYKFCWVLKVYYKSCLADLFDLLIY